MFDTGESGSIPLHIVRQRIAKENAIKKAKASFLKNRLKRKKRK